MARIYCVEDDDGIRELICCALKTGGYEAVPCSNAAEYKSLMNKKLPDLILLDIMLPDGDGIEILRKLRADSMKKDIPVIMLTAKSSEIDKVNGLENGADDYITKPFGVMELLSRIKAVLRRAGGRSGNQSELLSCEGLDVDMSRRTVSYNGVQVELTYKEFELLSCLMINRSLVMTREKLMEKVWGFQFEGETRTVDAHVKTLRQKLEQAGCSELIQTVRGAGYKIP
ncbi:MAG: response regulator transcription factor [Oscillospiraceae bacterium]|nr:response regulator transcription factor [Oscillospiraceae bacterium]